LLPRSRAQPRKKNAQCMVGTIFCLWTFTRLHCGNRSCSNCSLFRGSYFGSQKRIHYAVIGMLFFCAFHATSTVMHSVLSAASCFASGSCGLPLAVRSSSPAAFRNLGASGRGTARLQPQRVVRWTNLPRLRQRHTSFSPLGWSVSQQVFIKRPRSA